MDERLLDQVARALRADARVTVITGAGVSAASGVPTFRGADGLWKRFRVEELATPAAFGRDPEIVWEWYDWRRSQIASCAPNAAHHVLAAWSLRFPRFTLITQNVDGLHERAGTAHVLRFHGSIWALRCARACAASPAQWDDATAPFPSLPPRCPHCGGLARPGVVWFGERLDMDVVEASVAATACDVFLTIGTSATVYPAAGLMDHARQHGALTVEVNPDSTPASAVVDIALAGPAEAVLPEIDTRLPPHPLALETERLNLIPAMPADTAALHALWTLPDVRRYLWDDEVIPVETAAAVTAASARDFERHRFGLWSLIERGAGRPELAGFCGLRTGGIGDAPELLFALAPEYWRRGLVNEAALAVLQHAFGTLGLPRVIAATDAPNQRSARTLAALGFRFDRRGDHNGLDTLFFSLDAGDGKY